MKITQEVRDFAAKQNQSADSFLAANPPRNGEGASMVRHDPGHRADRAAAAEQPGPQAGGGVSEADAEKGMAEMSEKFKEKGGEIYLPAAE